MININKKMIVLMHRKDLQFDNEAVKLIIGLLSNIRNVP